MSNPYIYHVDVLASSPKEENEISERLKTPSLELVSDYAKEVHKSVAEVVDGFRDAIRFKATQTSNNSWGFENVCDYRTVSWVREHLFDVAQAFPTAVFLLTRWDLMGNFSAKAVIHKGEVMRQVFDGEHKAEAQDWVLLDIFAPFRVEHFQGVPVGSLWQEWVNDTFAVARDLKSQLAESGTV